MMSSRDRRDLDAYITRPDDRDERDGETMTLDELKEALATLGVNPEERNAPVVVEIKLPDTREPIIGTLSEADMDYDNSAAQAHRFVLKVEVPDEWPTDEEAEAMLARDRGEIA